MPLKMYNSPTHWWAYISNKLSTFQVKNAYFTKKWASENNSPYKNITFDVLFEVLVKYSRAPQSMTYATHEFAAISGCPR